MRNKATVADLLWPVVNHAAASINRKGILQRYLLRSNADSSKPEAMQTKPPFFSKLQEIMREEYQDHVMMSIVCSDVD